MWGNVLTLIGGARSCLGYRFALFESVCHLRPRPPTPLRVVLTCVRLAIAPLQDEAIPSPKTKRKPAPDDHPPCLSLNRPGFLTSVIFCTLGTRYLVILYARLSEHGTTFGLHFYCNSLMPRGADGSDGSASSFNSCTVYRASCVVHSSSYVPSTFSILARS